MHTTRHPLFAIGATLTLSALFLTWTASSAFALDGYKDRRGLFGGLGLGGGVGLVDTERDDESTGIDQGRKLGLHLSGILGGGITQNLVFGGEANWWIRTVRINQSALQHHHMSFNGVLNFFLIEGIYLEGGVGLAYAIFDVERNNQQTYRYQELGMSAKAGGGFEFFVNSDLAMGMHASYTRHFYTNSDFDTVSAGLTLRWY